MLLCKENLYLATWPFLEPKTLSCMRQWYRQRVWPAAWWFSTSNTPTRLSDGFVVLMIRLLEFTNFRTPISSSTWLFVLSSSTYSTSRWRWSCLQRIDFHHLCLVILNEQYSNTARWRLCSPNDSSARVYQLQTPISSSTWLFVLSSSMTRWRWSCLQRIDFHHLCVLHDSS